MFNWPLSKSLTIFQINIFTHTVYYGVFFFGRSIFVLRWLPAINIILQKGPDVVMSVNEIKSANQKAYLVFWLGNLWQVTENWQTLYAVKKITMPRFLSLACNKI